MPIGPDTFAWLDQQAASSDPTVRADAASLVKKLTTDELRAYADYQQAQGDKQPEGSAASRLIAGAASQLNPLTLIEGAGTAAMHPINALGNLIDAHVDQLKKAKEAYDAGHYTEAVGHLGGAALPVLGPAAATIGERIADTGDIATGVGEGAGLAATVFAPRVIAKGAGLAADAMDSPLGRKIGGRVVKSGATVVGAHVGGVPGALIGQEVGEELAQRIRKGGTPAASAPSPSPPGPSAPTGPTTTTPAPASAPPLGVTPPVSNNVTPPPNPQPPPATTPANTPAASAPSPAVKAALPIVRDWTVDEMQQVTKLPVEERQLYLKLRQVGDTHAEAIRTLDFQRESQALRDQASNARAMVGSSKAASDLFGTSTPDAVQKIHELAPGPSRPPLAGLTAAMDARFKQLISDPKMAWLLPLLGGAGLGALAQRKDANE